MHSTFTTASKDMHLIVANCSYEPHNEQIEKPNGETLKLGKAD